MYEDLVSLWSGSARVLATMASHCFDCFPLTTFSFHVAEARVVRQSHYNVEPEIVHTT